MERWVRWAHRGISDFQVDNIADEILRAEREITVLLRNGTVILAAIAGISLLVGGVGMYSVMKISLVERLYEIGLRQAMGATDGAILLQLGIESTTLSTLGGGLGCGLGALLAGLLSPQFEAGLPLSPLGLGLGISFAVAAGAFAGTFPYSLVGPLEPGGGPGGVTRLWRCTGSPL